MQQKDDNLRKFIKNNTKWIYIILNAQNLLTKLVTSK